MAIPVRLPDGWALIFDLDGVIVDSNPLHTRAWRAYLENLGIACDDIDRRMHGRRNDEIVADFIGTGLTPEQVFTHGAAKEQMYRQMMQSELEQRLVPGIRDFLAWTDGIPTAVASNAEPANVDFVLDGAALRPCFRVIVDGHQVARPKPYPDIYIRAAELLGVQAAKCVVFEDSATGVEAALAAGARVVGVRTVPAADLSGVDLIVGDFRERGLKDWLRSVEPKI